MSGASLGQRAVAHSLLERLLDAADGDGTVRSMALMVMGTLDRDGEVIAYSVVPAGFPGTGRVYRTAIKDFEAGMAAVAPFWADATPPEAGP